MNIGLVAELDDIRHRWLEVRGCRGSFSPARPRCNYAEPWGGFGRDELPLVRGGR
jgi:hypothetical protein